MTNSDWVCQEFGNYTGPDPRVGAAGGAIGFADFWVYGGLGQSAAVPAVFPIALSDFWQGVGVVYDWP